MKRINDFFKTLVSDKKKLFYNIGIFICAACFCVSLFMILTNRAEYKEGEDTYISVVQSSVEYSVEPIEPTDEIPEEKLTQIDLSVSPIKVDFEKLQAQNPDIIAWVYCYGTPINYPIVKTENTADYDYYLTHLVNGQENKAGTVFADYRNQNFLQDYNSLIYGHSMKNGTMFAYILRYRNQSFYDSHPYVWIYTPDATYRVSVIAGHYVTDTSDAFNMLTTPDSLKSYVSSAVSASAFKTNTDISSVQKIIQLSTCSYNSDNERFLLVGSVEEYK